MGNTMKKKLLTVLIYSFLSTTLFAQGEAAIPFITFQQSIQMIGAGQIGAAIANNDPFGFYYNPAQLGHTARTNHFSVMFLPEKINWILGITFNNYGASAGYNFKKNENDLPISIGFGFIHNKFDYGTFVVTGPNSPDPIGTYDSYDYFNCFSIGAGFDYYVQFNAGLSIKKFKSVLSDNPTATFDKPLSTEGTAFDFGLLVVVPLSKLFFDNTKMELGNNTLVPVADFTTGYSLLNLGKEIYYVDPSQKDPIPRTARLGYTIGLGLDLLKDKEKMNIFYYSFTSEADDILVYRDKNLDVKYQTLIGDIDIFRHIISLKSDDNVVVHKGHFINLFETLSLSTGRYDGRGFDNFKTSGLVVSSERIFRLIGSQLDNEYLKYFFNNFSIEYSEAKINITPFNYDVRFSGITLRLKNFTF